MRRWIVKVFNDNGYAYLPMKYQTYSVIATTDWDARLFAFILDQGIEPDKYGKDSKIEWDELELTKLYTEVVEGPLPD